MIVFWDCMPHTYPTGATLKGGVYVSEFILRLLLVVRCSRPQLQELQEIINTSTQLFSYGNALEVKDHQNNSPLELLMVNPY